MTDNSHQLEKINPHTGEPYKERPNKSQLKREMQELQELVRKLVSLPGNKLSEITLSERIHDGIVAAKKMQKSALQRQLRFLTGIMKEEDVETVSLQLKQLAIPHQQEVEQFHQIETWRDQLIDGDNTILNELIEMYQGIDHQYVRQLIRNANKEAKLQKAPKSSRLLFKYLKEISID